MNRLKNIWSPLFAINCNDKIEVYNNKNILKQKEK
jgi:hypothetical protein